MHVVYCVKVSFVGGRRGHENIYPLKVCSFGEVIEKYPRWFEWGATHKIFFETTKSS
jgi:hypothetical protein